MVVGSIHLSLLSLPSARKPFSALPLHGHVVYRDGFLDVPADQVDDRVRERFRTVVSVIGSPAPALRVPGPRVGGCCDIGADDCAERTATGPRPSGRLDLF